MKTLSDEIIDGGTRESVEAIIKMGANVNETDVYGYTPLIEAAIVSNSKSVEISSVLLEYGAEINQQDLTGRTALFWAADNNHVPLCKFLLDHKADPNSYSSGCQPLLVNPLLRGSLQVKNLLYKAGANLDFAQDYINAKLLGHRFELPGRVDIVNAKNVFIEISFEGFFLEFTVLIACDSLKRYMNNFAARHMRTYFKYIKKIIRAFETASELLKFQDYTIDMKAHQKQIDKLLTTDLLYLPIAYKGHAVSFAKYGNYLAKCDRGENSQREGTLVIYEIKKPQAFTKEFVKAMLYRKHDTEFIHHTINRILDLEPLTTLPLPAQLIGNCSWANVEGAIPAMLFLLFMQEGKEHLVYYKGVAISFYEQWREWDKARSLDECVQSFNRASPARRATKASILGRILFQKCQNGVPQDLATVEKILSILTIPEYQYILKSYVDVYVKKSSLPAGKNLARLLKEYEVYLQ